LAAAFWNDLNQADTQLICRYYYGKLYDLLYMVLICFRGAQGLRSKKTVDLACRAAWVCRWSGSCLLSLQLAMDAAADPARAAAPAAPTMIQKLSLKQTNSRQKAFTVAVMSLQLLQQMAQVKGVAAEVVVAEQIRQAVDKQLASSGQRGAEWTLLTSESDITDESTVAAAIMLHLQTRSTDVLQGLGEVQQGTLAMLLRVTNCSTGDHPRCHIDS
jgi:hypothetical protein